MSNGEWEGLDRRKQAEHIEAHGIFLARIDTNVENLIDHFRTHVEEDNDNFKELESKIETLQKLVYMGLGVFIVAEVIIKLIK